MTGRLQVRMHCLYPLGVDTVLTTVVGNIFAVTPGQPSLRQVLLPMGGPAVEAATFELPAGRYVVEAGLPSGQVLTEDVEIEDGGVSTVQLELTESPHETHTMQYINGNIEPSDIYHSNETYPVPASRGSRSFGDRGHGPAGPGLPPLVEVLSRGDVPAPAIENLNGLRPAPAAVAVAAVAGMLAPPGARMVLQPDFPEQLTPIFRLDEGTRAARPDFPWSAHRYQYVVVTTGTAAYLVTAPWPWPGGSGREVAIEMMVNLRQSPTGSAVSVAVNDPAIGAGLGYLSAGSLAKAAALFGDVESLLYSKVRNPIAAAAGGYVLIGTDTGAEQRPWDSWLANLRNWFPDLSDGAVLWGARRLRTARDDSEVEEARVALLEGYRRGLPVFTLGLTWLIDGLSQFPEDPDCATALLQVRHLAWRVDMREPFVVLRLGSDQ